MNASYLAYIYNGTVVTFKEFSSFIGIVGYTKKLCTFILQGQNLVTVPYPDCCACESSK